MNDKITIKNLQGESGIVNVVRYFLNNGSEYLIYSLNEVDEAGYTRLYVVKVSGVDGMYNADTLNDVEWNDIKNLVKTIVKANKENLPLPVQDINPQKIKNLLLKDKKIFKLNTPLVNDLASNKSTFNNEKDDSPSGGQGQSFDVPNTPVFNTPVQPTFEMPSAPTLETPAQPAFEMPSTPTLETPAQPAFEMPSAPAFDAPAQPAFEMPSTPTLETPAQPAFEMPSAPAFDAPAQPAFEMPSTPTLETPAQPAFEMPSTPAFDAPAQPAFEMPSTPAFDAPAQPAFEMPSTPTFDTPVQPTFEMPSTPAFGTTNPLDATTNQNTNNFGGFDFGATNTYETPAQNTSNDTSSMQQEIDRLNAELEKYKKIVENIKNEIEK